MQVRKTNFLACFVKWKPVQQSFRAIHLSLALANHYKLLGVTPGATKDEIKAAYKKMASLHHPDKHKGDKAKEEYFKKISNAYTVLSDEKERRQYDMENQLGAFKRPSYTQYEEYDVENMFDSSNWYNFGGSSSGVPFDDTDSDEDMFRNEFTGFSWKKKRKKRPHPKFDTTKLHIKHKLEITLEDLYAGSTKEIQFTRNVLCTKCKGYGTTNTVKTKCQQCQGSGVVVTHIAGMQQHSGCEVCDGTGELISRKDNCQECRGHGVISTKTKATVVTPFGAEKGDAIVLSGLGNEFFDKHRSGIGEKHVGDSIVELEEIKHPSFIRSGYDLMYTRTLSLAEALGGYSFDLKLADGSTVNVASQPQGKIVVPDTVYMLKGKGMPKNKYKQTFGNLFVTFKIDYPARPFLPKDFILDLQSILDRKKRARYEPGDFRNGSKSGADSENETIDEGSATSDGSESDPNERDNGDNKREQLESVFLLEVPFFTKVPEFEKAKKDEKTSADSTDNKKGQASRSNFENKEKERKHQHESRRRRFRGW